MKKKSNPGWFPKGRSPNPKGRPRGSRSSPPSVLEVLLDKTVPVAEDGIMREIGLEQALQERIFQDALDGKPKAVRQVLKWIEKREAWLAKREARRGPAVVGNHISPDPDNADAALVLLGIAVPDPDRSEGEIGRARLRLMEWAVEAGLRRRRRRLNESERNTVDRCTARPRRGAR